MSAADRNSESPDESALNGLILQARAGSVAALNELLERLSEFLWVALNNRDRRNSSLPGGSRGSSDLVQDTLARVKQQFGKFERDTFADFKQWARTILYRRRQEWARNHRARGTEHHKRMIWNELRVRAEVRNEELLELWPAEHREEVERAYAIFQTLKPHEQFVIDLRLFQGLNYKQIAELTGSTEDASRQAFNRAIARLRAAYERDKPS